MWKRDRGSPSVRPGLQDGAQARGGGFPAATKAVSEWFPVRERSTAMGIINAGTAVGAVVAPPAIAAVIANLNWRWVFFLCGAVGLSWTVWWMRAYFAPAQHPKLTAEEYEQIEEVFAATQQEKAAVSWLSLFSFPQVWGLVCGKFLSDAAWYFYLFWLPKYLYDARGFDLKQIGAFAWVPFVAAGLGSVFGGWLAGFLIGRGWSVDKARKVIIGVSCLLMPAGIVAAYTSDAMFALAMISVVLFGFQVWINNVQTLPSDFFPKSAVGSVAGLGGMGAGIGSMIFTFTTGWVVDSFSYAPILVAAGLLGPIGTVVLFLLAGKIQKISRV